MAARWWRTRGRSGRAGTWGRRLVFGRRRRRVMLHATRGQVNSQLTALHDQDRAHHVHHVARDMAMQRPFARSMEWRRAEETEVSLLNSEAPGIGGSGKACILELRNRSILLR